MRKFERERSAANDALIATMRAFLYAPSGINCTTSNLYRSMFSSLISLSVNRNCGSTK